MHHLDAVLISAADQVAKAIKAYMRGEVVKLRPGAASASE